jgi:hypothetical protein
VFGEPLLPEELDELPEELLPDELPDELSPEELLEVASGW